VAPQLAAGENQYQIEQNQMGQINAQTQLTEQQNQYQAQQQLAGLGIANQQLGLQQQGLQQQGAQQQAQQQYEQQQYNIQSGQYPEQFAEAALSYQNALMNMQGQQAIGGTQNTVGGKAQMGMLGANYGFQLQDITRAQQLAGIGQQAEVSGFQYGQQQLQNASANLGLIAKSNNMSVDQVYQALQFGQEQAGLGAQSDVLGLLGQMNQTALQNITTAGTAIAAGGIAAGKK
jgi:hypothetical protein